jgi:ribonucleoside-diphosphate reductase beta chain
MLLSWFPKHEIKQMAMMFGSQETIHAVAYSYLNETLGLDDFKAFST